VSGGRRSRAAPRLASAVALLVITAELVACGPGGSSGSSASAATPAPSAPSASPLPATPASSPAASTSDETPVPLAVDPALLGVLPATAGKVAMVPDPENAAQLIGDPTLRATASGLAVARYASGDDIMVVSVTQLRPGVYSDGFFDSWRQEYDGSACEPAGGVSGAEKVDMIGTLVVHVGACAGGASTYHAVLDGDVLVSAIAVGPGSLGHDVMAGIKP